MDASVAAVLLVVLLLGPLVTAQVERHIELFFLAVGLAAITLAGQWSGAIALQAAREPLPITFAVVAAGLIFRALQTRMDRLFERLRHLMAGWALTALGIFVIALAASVITAIVAALVLVQLIRVMRVAENSRGPVTVCGCFAIGLGASLTPVGEPLSTLAAQALKLPLRGLLVLLGPFVIPGLVVCAVLGGFFAARARHTGATVSEVRQSLLEVLTEGAKVYAFVAGLVLISEAFAPIARHYLDRLPSAALYWANMVSAVLDNATLVALEVHGMELPRAREAIVALLVSGGMLIPGNIPNIIAAGLLRIPGLAWAKVGMPLGLVLMIGYFFALGLHG